MAAVGRTRVPDCAPPIAYHLPSKLERLARELGAPPGELRVFLRDLVQRRLRERGDAWKKLDETLEQRARRNGNGR